MSDDASALTDQIRAAVADAHQRVTSAGRHGRRIPATSRPSTSSAT